MIRDDHHGITPQSEPTAARSPPPEVVTPWQRLVGRSGKLDSNLSNFIYVFVDEPSEAVFQMRKKSNPRAAGTLRNIIQAEAHHHLVTAMVVGICTFGGTTRTFNWPVSLIMSWDAFALTSLLLAWGGMLISGAKARVQEAQLQDASRSAIACCMIVAALASLFGAGILLAEAKTLTGKEVIGHVALAAATVTASWFLVHTLLAVHYTHLFFSSREGTASSQFAQGLDFPGEKEPDFLDFAYFSFVIGMTFQVSDVQVTSRSIRRMVLVHSLLSFAFNTVILAFSINLATTLL